MSDISRPSLENTALVVVAYNPDKEFASRLERASKQFSLVVLVDNANSPASQLIPAIKEKLAILGKGENIGLSKALNLGCDYAFNKGKQWVVTLDQDTDLENAYLDSMASAWASIPTAIIIGCNYKVPNGKKAKFSTQNKQLTIVRTVITSGTLLSKTAREKIGGFNQDFFIDAIDHEFCLRARRSNVPVYLNTEVLAQHSIGNSLSSRFAPFYTNPKRYYTITRNSTKTIKEYFTHEPIWSLRACLSLGLYLLSIITNSHLRKEKLQCYFRGFFQGISSKALARTKNLENLIIIGVHKESEAYPNSLYRIQDISSSKKISMDKIHCEAWSSPTGKRSITLRVKKLCRLTIAHIAVTTRLLGRNRSTVVYITYPSIILCLLAALSGRKKIVLDAFISIYDTVVFDRKLISKNSLKARILFYLEKQAFLRADRIITDTAENSDYYSTLFKINRDKFVSIPLSTNEDDFQPAEYKPVKKECTVLFIGTLIPLHGIQYIAQSLEYIQGNPDIHVRIIGNGQEQAHLAPLLKLKNSNITWVRDWQNSKELANQIAQTDICLGIFGNTEKSSRVIPYKIYAYSRIGRAIISKTSSAHVSSTAPDNSPWHSIDLKDPKSLADEILRLSHCPEERKKLALASSLYYETHLSNANALSQFENMIIKLANETHQSLRKERR